MQHDAAGVAITGSLLHLHSLIMSQQDQACPCTLHRNPTKHCSSSEGASGMQPRQATKGLRAQKHDGEHSRERCQQWSQQQRFQLCSLAAHLTLGSATLSWTGPVSGCSLGRMTVSSRLSTFTIPSVAQSGGERKPPAAPFSSDGSHMIEMVACCVPTHRSTCGCHRSRGSQSGTCSSQDMAWPWQAPAAAAAATGMSGSCNF